MTHENILIVEDEGLTSLAISKMLRKSNYNPLTTVSSGEEALKYVRQNSDMINLILMDIILDGDLDGIETAKEITKHFNIPIVFITALEDVQTFENAKLEEPFGYVIKPIKGINDIRPAIETAIYNFNMKEKVKKKLAMIHSITKSEMKDDNLSKITPNEEELVSKEPENIDLSQLKEDLVDNLSALANTDRFLIMNALKAHPMKLNDVQLLIDKSRSATSHNLQILEKNGYIKGWKKGRFTYYSLSKPDIETFLKIWKLWLTTFPAPIQ